MAGARRQMHAYIGWAVLGSMLVVALAVLLGRMSHQLAQSRVREAKPSSPMQSGSSISPITMA